MFGTKEKISEELLLEEETVKQSEIVLCVCFSNSGDALHGLLIAHMTTQSIAGVSGVDDNAPITNYAHCLGNQALLRIIWMNFEVLAHAGCYRTLRCRIVLRSALSPA